MMLQKGVSLIGDRYNTVYEAIGVVALTQERNYCVGEGLPR